MSATPTRDSSSVATLVTGAGGFVGAAVVERLVRDGTAVRAAVRRTTDARAHAPGAERIVVPDVSASTDWSVALAGIAAVVHCAARVHVVRDGAADPLAAFRAVNVDGTARLARAAAAAGVRRFVFVSSIGVNGAETTASPYTADDVPAPRTPYARSKLEAERVLASIARETGLEVTVVRPPMVYGPHAPGNVATLVGAVRRGLPLPLASIRNRRSFVGLANLVDLLVRCTGDARAAGRTLLVSDGEDLSTPELVRRIARAFGVRPRLLPLPVALLRGATRLAGREALAQQLCGSLQIDAAATRAALDWLPPSTVDTELARMARADNAGRPPSAGLDIAA